LKLQNLAGNVNSNQKKGKNGKKKKKRKLKVPEPSGVKRLMNLMKKRCLK